MEYPDLPDSPLPEVRGQTKAKFAPNVQMDRKCSYKLLFFLSFSFSGISVKALASKRHMNVKGSHMTKSGSPSPRLIGFNPGLLMARLTFFVNLPMKTTVIRKTPQAYKSQD